MRRALMQTQALTNFDQPQLGTLQVKAEEHIDGLLNRGWPRRCLGREMTVSHIEILFHNVEQV